MIQNMLVMKCGQISVVVNAGVITLHSLPFIIITVIIISSSSICSIIRIELPWSVRSMNMSWNDIHTGSIAVYLLCVSPNDVLHYAENFCAVKKSTHWFNLGCSSNWRTTKGLHRGRVLHSIISTTSLLSSGSVLGTKKRKHIAG